MHVSNQRIKLCMEFKKNCDECQTEIDELFLKIRHKKGFSFLKPIVLETKEGVKHLYSGEYRGGYVLMEEYLDSADEIVMATVEIDNNNGSEELIEMLRENGFKDYKQEESK